jgi:hypothetical protein
MVLEDQAVAESICFARNQGPRESPPRGPSPFDAEIEASADDRSCLSAAFGAKRYRSCPTNTLLGLKLQQRSIHSDMAASG